MPRVHAGGALDGLLDLVFPRRCVVCRAAGAWLCDGLCRRACIRCPGPLPPLRRAAAARRQAGPPARPDGVARGMPACRECAGRDLAFSAASAAFSYDGPARALVTACKFRALRSLADEMAHAAAPRFAAPPPGGRRRTPSSPRCRPTATTGSTAASTRRRCSPAGLRATAGLTYAPLLRRVRHGARQSGLDRAVARGQRPSRVRVAGGRITG